jgi:hypothetical protein
MNYYVSSTGTHFGSGMSSIIDILSWFAQPDRGVSIVLVEILRKTFLWFLDEEGFKFQEWI